VLDELSPEPTTARNMRWASVSLARVAAGRRAPDATGLTRAAVTGPLRLFQLLSSRGHTLLLHAGGATTAAQLRRFESLAEAAVGAAHGHMDVYLIAAPDVDVDATVLPLIRDGEGSFARAYGGAAPSVFVVRPDGYLGCGSSDVSDDGVQKTLQHLRTVFA
jgi:hypothetical protein